MRLLAGATLALVAHGASGEVRIAHRANALTLETRLTRDGIWTPSTLNSVRDLLNPDGDRTRDGVPSQALIGDVLLAAWARPVTQEIVVAEISSPTSVRYLSVPSGPIVGAPSIEPLAGGAILAWQRADRLEVDAALWSGGEFSEPAFLQEGSLVALHGLGDSAALVTVDRIGGTIIIGEIVGISHPHPIPIPPPTQRDQVMAPFLGSDAMPMPCLRADSSSLVLTWSLEPRKNAVVRVDARGIEGPDVLHVPGGSCTAMLNAVSR